jgi:hypothetical protein
MYVGLHPGNGIDQRYCNDPHKIENIKICTNESLDSKGIE